MGKMSASSFHNYVVLSIISDLVNPGEGSWGSEVPPFGGPKTFFLKRGVNVYTMKIYHWPFFLSFHFALYVGYRSQWPDCH